MIPRGTATRFPALLLLAAALWNPEIAWHDAPLDLMLLLDDSLSMDPAWLDRAWDQLRETAATLPPGSRIALVRFAGDARVELRAQPADGRLPESVPRGAPLQRGQTDPAAALEVAATLWRPDRATRLLLLGDGRTTRGMPVWDGPPDRTRLLWWRPPPTPAPATWIRDLQAPARAGTGERVTVGVGLAGTPQPGMRLALELDGRPLEATDAAGPWIELELPAPGPGLYRLEAVLSRDAATLSRRTALLRVADRARVLLVAAGAAGSTLADSLRRGGWPVQALPPEAVRPQLLETVDVVILDDIPVHALDQTLWQALARRVRQQGMGLLVLGGPSSFAAGGYRHSLLEGLLPVTAEAPRPQPPAALLFLVDSSGSMGRRLQPEAPSRLALARRAVLETAAGLEPGDRTGLLAFDLEPRELLALGLHRAPVRALERSWDLQPAGGTRLAPALARGIERLREAGAEQRLLVLVTDGFLEESVELERLAATAAAARIRVIALAIGPEAQLEPLERLARAGGGRLLTVAEVAQLPRLMRQEVARERKPVQRGPVTPRANAGFDLLQPHPDAWPPLAAYALARPRPGARVPLTAPDGDPLLAEWIAGAGRVVALPGGLGPWAGDWRRWARWGELLGGLIEWTAALHDDGLFVTADDEGDGEQLRVEAVERNGGWAAGPLQATAADPLGRSLPVTVELQAPGRWLVRVPARLEGTHRLALRLDGRLLHHSFHYRPAAELEPGTRVDPGLLRALAQGRVRPWRPGLSLAPQRQRLPTRPLFAGLALLAFLLALVSERELLPGVRRPGLTLPGRAA